MTHPAEAERGIVHARAGVPDVRDGDPGRGRARSPSTTCGASASCGRASARSPPATRTRGSATPRRPRRSARRHAAQPDDRRARTRKYMNSNNDVDMAAAVSCARSSGPGARRARGPLGVPARRHRLPRAPRTCPTGARSPGRRRSSSAAGGRSSWPASASTTSTSSTCTRASRRRCSSARPSLGLDLDRQLTRTGGLPFAGGPWNNYVMHAIATVVDDLRERPGRAGPGVGQRRLRHQARLRRVLDDAARATASATTTRRTRSTPCPAASSPSRPTPPGRRRRGVHGHARPRRRARARYRRLPARRRPPGVGHVERPRRRWRRSATASGSAPRPPSPPTAPSTA